MSLRFIACYIPNPMESFSKHQSVLRIPSRRLTITYPNKAGEFTMFEELRDNRAFKDHRVLHHKGFSIVRPAGNVWITGTDHVIGFCCTKKKE